MYKDNFVVAVKADGKVLREFGDTVYLPFGTEYTILLKNMQSLGAKVHVRIDGADVLDGSSLILKGDETLELRRFIKNGNLTTGNAFKFIEKTDKIEKHRGNRPEDGLLVIDFEFASASPLHRLFSGKQYDKYADYDKYPFLKIYSISGNLGYDASMGAFNSASTENSLFAHGSVETKAGITAPGSIQEQKFTRTRGFVGDGVHHRIVIHLKGLVDSQTEVRKPVTVKKHKECVMCGTTVKQTAKFCHECGASVEIA